MKFVTAAVLGVMVVLATLFFLNYQKTSPVSEYLQQLKPSNQVIKEGSAQDLESKYGEYAELTIPFLRSRSYEGSQIELKQILGEFPSYTSHLASYSSDGLTINGVLTIPTGEPPKGGFPAVVFLHGYVQPNLYKTTEKYVDYVNYLARNGLVVYKIDLRGHGESEGEPSGAYFSGDYIVDTLNAVESLKKMDSVNPDQIGLWGHSMSGNTVLRTMVVDPKIKAGVIWAGAVYSYTDFTQYRLNDRSFVRRNDIPSRFLRRSTDLFSTVGEISEDNDFWKMVAPTNYLDELGGGIQLHHAENDEVVNINYSRELSERLEKSGASYELHTYSQGGHNLSSPSFTQAMMRTVEFYQEQFR